MTAQYMKLSNREFMKNFASDVSLRIKVFEQLKKHLLEGYSLDCFGPMSEVTIHESMKKYPLEWDIEELEHILRKAKSGWEQIGRGQALGTCLGNSRSWYYNMSNRYGWSDKSKVETSGTAALTVSIVDYATSKGLKENISEV